MRRHRQPYCQQHQDDPPGIAHLEAQVNPHWKTRKCEIPIIRIPCSSWDQGAAMHDRRCPCWDNEKRFPHMIGFSWASADTFRRSLGCRLRRRLRGLAWRRTLNQRRLAAQ
jgi:hypothetical protein